uniref:Uncharacterized protein n=1 Tax=Human herpesvirus 2 TaxID=10310 RepID=A0A481TYN4_HHV2|nr:hypothetical protein [Human alphaherpesvirus 2]
MPSDGVPFKERSRLPAPTGVWGWAGETPDAMGGSHPKRRRAGWVGVEGSPRSTRSYQGASTRSCRSFDLAHPRVCCVGFRLAGSDRTSGGHSSGSSGSVTAVLAASRSSRSLLWISAQTSPYVRCVHREESRNMSVVFRAQDMVSRPRRRRPACEKARMLGSGPRPPGPSPRPVPPARPPGPSPRPVPPARPPGPSPRPVPPARPPGPSPRPGPPARPPGPAPRPGPPGHRTCDKAAVGGWVLAVRTGWGGEGRTKRNRCARVSVSDPIRVRRCPARRRRLCLAVAPFAMPPLPSRSPPRSRCAPGAAATGTPALYVREERPAPRPGPPRGGARGMTRAPGRAPVLALCPNNIYTIRTKCERFAFSLLLPCGPAPFGAEPAG